jgi:ribonuclease D
MAAEENSALFVADQETLEEVVTRAEATGSYALDTEFIRERRYWPKLALVQLAWGGPAGGVAVVDPLAVDVGVLSRLLEGPGVMVAHASDQDLEVLERACGRGPSRLWDTQIAAGFVGHGSASLARLVEAYLGRKLAKGDRLADWSRRPLTRAELDYAAADVEHLLELGEAIGAELDRLGRRTWAEEECAALLARPRGGGVPERAWWKLRDARALRGESRGVAQEVAAWRERRAQVLDVPTRNVMSDLSLQAIAGRPPASVEDLARVRGIDGRLARPPLASELLGAIERGRSLGSGDVSSPPSEHVPKELQPAVALVMAYVGQVARDESVEAVRLATRADVAAFVARRDVNGRDGGAGRLASGWRAGLLAEPIRALLAGRAALSFDGSGRVVLEERIGYP